MTAARRAGEPGLATVKRWQQLLTVLLLVGSLVLVTIPIAALWMLATIGSGVFIVYVLVLAAAAMAMILWGGLLVWLDRLRAHLASDRSPDSSALGHCLAVAVIVVVAALLVWLILFAGSGPDIRGPFPD
jgi:archaellum biogenesis protein FlaJ (TadC family)